MRRKQSLAAILALLLLANLSACGRAEDREEEKLVEGWAAEVVVCPDWFQLSPYFFADVCLENGVLYCIGKSDGAPAVAAYDTAGDSWERLPFAADGLTDPDIRCLSAAEGVLWALLRSQGADDGLDFYLLRWELASPAPAQSVPVRFSAADNSEGSAPIFSGLLALSADRALLYDWDNAYELDAAATRLRTVALQGRSLYDSCRVNGDLYLGDEDNGCALFDADNLRFGGALPYRLRASGGSENGHLLVNGADRQLLALDPETGELTELFNWLDVAVDTSAVGGGMVFESAAGDFYYPNTRGLVRVSRATVKEKTVLTLVILDAEDRIGTGFNGELEYLDSILLFNLTNPDYKIAVKTLSPENGSYDRALMELATSRDYDLVDCSILPENGLGDRLLADLLPLLDADGAISREDFLQPLLQSMLRRGALYELSPRYTLVSAAVRAENFPGREGWTIDYVNQLIANRDPETQALFWTQSREYMARLLIGMATAEFVDYDRAVCSFDSENCKQWLEFVRELPYTDGYRDAPVLLSAQTDLASAAGLSVKLGLRSEDYVYCGLPGTSGNGSYFAALRFGQTLEGGSFGNPVRLGILSASAHEEAAWAFLRLVLQEDSEWGVQRGIPVLRDSFERCLTARINEEEIWGYADFDRTDADKLRELVYGTEQYIRQDEALTRLMTEVLDAYFAGRYTTEEAAALLQSRASLYIAEQYG